MLTDNEVKEHLWQIKHISSNISDHCSMMMSEASRKKADVKLKEAQVKILEYTKSLFQKGELESSITKKVREAILSHKFPMDLTTFNLGTF